MSFYAREKYRLIIRPFWKIGIACIVGFSALHFLLLLLYPVLPFREDLFRIIVPMIIPWAPLLIWLRPGLKQLKFSAGRQNVFGYLLLATIAICVPIIILQECIPIIAGSHRTLSNMNQIRTTGPARFFRIDSFYTEKRAMRERWMKTVSGKYNKTLEYHYYTVLPVYADSVKMKITGRAEDTTATLIVPGRFSSDDGARWLDSHPPVAWMGLHHQIRISNRASGLEKSNALQKFRLSVSGKMNTSYFDSISWWQLAKNDVDRKRLLLLIPEKFTQSPLWLLSPIEEKTLQLPGKKFFWFVLSAGLGFLIFSLAIHFTPMKTVH